jgi:dTDP-4-amino-4,6-dideoxygalactose transaminase
MEPKTNLNVKIHDKLDEWMSKLDHFQLQLSLGKMEAVDEYEKQRKNFHEYLHEFTQTVNTIQNITEEKAEEVKKVLNDYKSKVLKEEAVTEKVIEKEKKSVEHLLDKINEL